MKAVELEKSVSKKLTRHTLRNWEKFLPKQRGRKKGSDEYTDSQVVFLVRMLQATLSDDLPPGRAAKRAARTWFDQEEQTINDLLKKMARVGRELISKNSSEVMLALLREYASIPANALRRGESLDRFACMTRMLLDAKECGIFMPDRAGLQALVLVADAKGAREPTQLGHRIENYPESDSPVARAAHMKKRFNLLAPKPQNGSNPDFRSSLTIPLVDRKGAVRVVIHAEGKQPPSDLRFGAFTDQDERVITAVAASLLPLVELERMLVRGIDIVHRLNSPGEEGGIWTFRGFAKDLVKAALTLAAADRCEVSIWDATRGVLVFQGADENNRVKAGDALEASQPSVTYAAYFDCESKAYPDVSKEPMYRICNEGMNSEIAVPLVAPSRNFRGAEPGCFGVLNVESGKRGAMRELEGDGGLEEQDVPMLTSLATIGSVGFQLAQFKTCLGENLSPGQIKSVTDRVEKIAADEIRKRFEAALYVVDYVAGCLVLRDGPDGVDPPTLSFEDGKTKTLAAQVVEENKGLFSVRPETDPRVWAPGLERFCIRGSLIAVPLFFRTGLGRTVVAVISAWNVTSLADRERLNEMEALAIIQRCERELLLELALK